MEIKSTNKDMLYTEEKFISLIGWGNRLSTRSDK